MRIINENRFARHFGASIWRNGALALLFTMLFIGQSAQAQANLYTFVNSASGNPLETITSPTVLTTTIGGTFDNDYNLITPAGFTFNFGGVDYTQFAVSTNGWIRLGNTAPPPQSGSISQLGIDGIYAFTRDANMNVTNGGNLTHGPAADGKYVFHFVKISGAASPNATSYADAQIVLWGSTSATPGRIEIIYGASSTAPTSQFRAGIGDTMGRTYDGIGGLVNGSSLSSAWLAEGRKFTFTPPPACVIPAQPTALAFGTTSFSNIALSYTAAAGASYLVVRYPAGATPTPPVNGTTYVTNNMLGSQGVVAAATNFTSVNAANLSGATSYDFYIYSYVANCLGSPMYNQVSPLTGTRTTLSGTTSGVKTVGSGGDYPTLTAAFNAIAGSGLNGPMELKLIAGYPAGTESYPLGNNLTSGVLNGHTLDIYPTVSGLSISSTSFTAININGASNVTIDGRVNRTGAADLSILTTAVNSAALSFSADASFNTVKYCHIKSANASANGGTIAFINTAVTGCDNNTIDHCNISDSSGLPANGIYSSNSNANDNGNSGNRITYNNIYNYFSATTNSMGIQAIGFNSEWVVTNNRFFQEAARTVTSPNVGYLAISIATGAGHTIKDNVIGFADVTGTGLTQINGTNALPRILGISIGLGGSSVNPTLIENNIIGGISTTSTGASTSSGVTVPAFGGIYAGGSGAVAPLKISGNTIGTEGSAPISVSYGSSFTNAAAGIVCSVSNPNQQVEITGNTLSGIAVTSSVAAVGTGFTGIYTSNTAASTATISNNIIGSESTNSITLGTPGFTSGTLFFTGIESAGGASTASAAKTNNTIRNVTVYASSGTVMGIRQGAIGTNVVQGNNIRNMAMASTVVPVTPSNVTLCGINSNGTIATENADNNTVQQLGVAINTTSATSVYGIMSDLLTEGVKTISGNLVSDLSYANTNGNAAVNGILYGIFSRRSAQVSKNKIYNITAGTGTGSVAYGMYLDSAQNGNLSNNFVGAINTLSSGGTSTSSAVVGIFLNGSVANGNVYYNTIWLSGAGGPNNYTTGLFSGVNTSCDLRNNIIVNKSAVNGTGRAVALQRGTTSLATYASTSNNNLLYTGTPAANRLLYFDGNGDQTLAAFKTRMFPREVVSRSDDPVFISTTGSDSGFLHIHASDDSGIESGGTPISGITTDYDGQSRDTTAPDMGADEGAFTPYVVVDPHVTVTSTGGAGAPMAQYPTFGEALIAINAGIHTGTIVCTVDAGYAETAPAGGYVISASGTAAEPIMFTKSAGANPVFTASAAHNVASYTDAVIKIVGGDYITIDGFTLQENAANTNLSPNTMTEMGIGLFYASTTDGAQHCTIRNCTIDLSATWTNSAGIYSNSAHSATSGALATATTAAGANSFLTIINNTITDVTYGVLVYGPMNTDWNDGLVIGGAPDFGNTITAFGTNGNGSNNFTNVNSNHAEGIVIRNTKNYNLSYNTITSNSNITNAAAKAIWVVAPNTAATDAGSNTISHNTVSVRIASSSYNLDVISVDGGTGSVNAALSIDHNDISNSGYAVAGTGTVNLIRNASSFGTLAISDNTFTGLTLGTTGAVFAIFNQALSTVSAIDRNMIVGGLTRTAGTNGITGISSASGGSVSGNVFSNISNVGGNFNGISISAAAAQPMTITSNTVSNVSGIGAAFGFTGIGVFNPAAGSIVGSNTVASITGGTVNSTGINVTNNTISGVECKGNTVTALTSNGTNALFGIYVATTNATVSGNKIGNLECNNAGAIVSGIYTAVNTGVAISNNIIGDLRNPIGNGTHSVVGINVSNTATASLYHNTVYLNAASSGTNFGSSALFVSSQVVTDLRNNILFNNSTSNGTSLSVAYRRSASSTAAYLPSSNNNLLRGNVVYHDGVAITTLDMLKSRFYPREITSIGAAPAFLSTSAASPDFLHISPADNTGIESGGEPIGVTVDFDGTTRSTSTPDIGADEGSFVALPAPGYKVHVTSTGGTSPVKDYISLGTALAAINTGTVHTGTIVCTVDGGHTEIAPASGYVITATGTASDPITFMKGAGDNPVFTASPYYNTGDIFNGIFKIVGSDYITLDGFTMTENPANTTIAQATNNMVEFGVALLMNSLTDGAQHCTIKNCTIDLDRNNPFTIGIYSNSGINATNGSVTITSFSGSNSYLSLTGNTITDVNTGIMVNGGHSDAAADEGLIIGGSTYDGNSITGICATSMPGLPNFNVGGGNGIIVRNARNYTISYNTIATNGTLNALFRGIYIGIPSFIPITGTIVNHIDRNQISARLATNTTVTVDGILVDANSSNTTTTLTIDNNNFSNFGNSIAGVCQHLVNFIRNQTTSGNLSIKGNTFSNIALNTSSSVTLISNNTIFDTCDVENNGIIGSFANASTASPFTGYANSAASTGALTLKNNEFSNISGGAGFVGINLNPQVIQLQKVENNTISDISGFTGNVVGVILNNGATGSRVTGNTLRNMTSSGGAPIGISMGGLGTANTDCDSNDIGGFTANGAATTIGIVFQSGNSTSIHANKVYNLENTTTGGAVNGISVLGGNANSVYNNRISDLRAPVANVTSAVNGISISNPGNSYVYHNTVLLNATSSGANFGSAALSTGTSTMLYLRNNILVNTSSAAGTGVSAVFKRTGNSLPTYSTTSDNNLFFGTAIYSDGTTDVLFNNFKTRVSPRESHSISENPVFVSTSPASPDYLHIDPTSVTGIESGGVFINTVTVDADGDLRNTATPDIGADEGTFTGTDITGPTITYTPLTNRSDTTNPTLSDVVITDAAGVNVTTAKPRLYYKKSSETNNVAGWKFVEATGTNSPYTFTINYAALYSGMPVLNDIIQYFVVAEDLDATPAVGIHSGNFATVPTGVNLVSANFPIQGTINSFQILPVLSGVKTVCPSGCDYASLTLTGGAFDMINKSTVNGNITLQIAGNLMSETGLIRLNEFASPYTVTIKPTGAQRTISGSGSAILILNGADNVIIDGSLSETENSVCPAAAASRDLTIINTSNSVSAVVWMQSNGINGATDNVIKNCNISGFSNSSTLAGIGSGSSAISSSSFGTSNHRNAILNNSIKRTQIGIYTQGASYANKNNGTVISQNEINGSDVSGDNVRWAGIFAGFENDITISGNRIANVEGNTSTAYGIVCGNLSANTSLNGNEVTNAKITDNFVDRVRWGTANFTAGIFLSATANTSGTSLIANNAVSNTFGKGSDSGFGIIAGAGLSTVNIYHNTVNMSGTSTGGVYPNFALGYSGNATGAINIRNNVLVNSVSNGSGSGAGLGAYAMGFSNQTNVTSNNNLFYTSGPDAKFTKFSLTLGGAEYATLAAHRSATGKDLQSINTNVVFTSSTDLRPLNTDAANAVFATAGADVSGIVPVDVDCEDRSTTPSIGFKEFYICGPLAGGTALATMPSPVLPQAELTATGFTTGTTIRYQWQSSADAGFSVVTNLTSLSATYSPYVVTTFPGTLYYRMKTTCSNGGATEYSTSVRVDMIPPGNCLSFDGVDDFVTAVPSVPVSGDFTVEAWVRPMHPTKNMHIFNTRMTGEESFDIQLDAGNKIHGDIGNGNSWLTTNADANYNYEVGKWMHIAYAVSTTGYTIYVNGEVAGSGSYAGTPLLFDGDHYLEIGLHGAYTTYFDGSIDEVKVYKSVRTAAEIRQDMVSTTTNDPVNLVMYYNFDNGLAGADNPGIMTLSGSSPATPNASLSAGFALTGGTGNWVESYAMILPVIQPATDIVTAFGFTANWSVPVNLQAEGYVLDVATSKSFNGASMVAGYDGLAVSGTSQVVTGLTPGTYYYRVRANKASVNGQGAYVVSDEVDIPSIAPGNALQFNEDGVVTINDTTVGNFGTGEFTIEFNVLTTSLFTPVLSKRATCGHANFWDIGVFDGTLQIEIDQDASATNYLAKHGNIKINDGRWHHVAITRSAAGLLSLYIDGVLDVTGAAAGITDLNNAVPIRFNPHVCANTFNGSIDEFRMWNVARSESQIQAARQNVLTLPQSGLVAYYKFDAGVASGQNAGITTLKDYSGNGRHGTLDSFNLYGNTGNWVESYAMVTAAMAPSSGLVLNGFTANWTAPSTGMADSYVLDVSTNAAFSSYVSGYQGLSVNGTSATLTGLDGGVYYYRVRPSKNSVPNQGPYTATSAPVTVSILPPGNALRFDGTNDYVSYSAPANIPVGNSPYTLESWIYPTAMGTSGIIGYGNYGTAKQVNALRLSGNGIVNYWWSTDLSVVTGNITNAWHHVAATFDGTTRKIYLDGVVVAQDTPTGHNVPNANNLTIGTSNNNSEFFNGKMDETRIWNVALTQAQIQANMSAPVNPASSGLVLYNNYDKGSLVNSNAGNTSVPDQSSNGLTGTMQNFNFTASSNWVESYAMVIPVMQPATSVGVNTFTANWSAPVTGTANSYLLDVSTSPTFSTFLPGYQNFSVSGTSAQLNGLAPGTYYYRLAAKKTGLADRSMNSAVSAAITIGGTTTWNGTAWSNGVPDTTMYAIIAGDYSSTGNLAAANLTVNNNAVVTINSGHDLTVTGPLTISSGSLTIEVDANLVQSDNVANTGNIVVKRDVKLWRQDYAFWGSPVSGQNLRNFSPVTLPNRFYTFDPVDDVFDQLFGGTATVSTTLLENPATYDFLPAKGYMVRAPNTFLNPAYAQPELQQTFHGIFTGIPNNGNYSAQVTNAASSFHMVSNPYPSTVNATQFLTANPGTIYFWTHHNQDPGGSNYAYFNTFGAAAAYPGGVVPNGTIQVGQGFLFYNSAALPLVSFTNAMRTADNSGQFFRTSNDRSRIWLNLSSGDVPGNQTLIGYTADATPDIDAGLDGKYIQEGNGISSLIGNQRFAIQARPAFDDTDIVPLSLHTVTSGSFTVSIDHVDGIFSDDQDVFLKDNLTGMTHDLKGGPYTFASEAGTLDQRFELVYQSTSLGIDNPEIDTRIVLYHQDGLLHVDAGSIVLKTIRVFDIRGRLLYGKENIHTTNTALDGLSAEQEMLLVQITSEDGRTVTKKAIQ